MTPLRTPEGLWVLFHATTGQRIERWSVDARGMLENGEYLDAPPEATQDTPAADPPAEQVEDAPAADTPIAPVANTAKRRR